MCDDTFEDILFERSQEFEKLYEDYIKAPTYFIRENAKAKLKAFFDSVIKEKGE